MDIQPKMALNGPKLVVIDRGSENRKPREHGHPNDSRIGEQSVAHFLLQNGDSYNHPKNGYLR